ncbi:hypothetical protein V6N12_000534, partial [Hibiscus sabdariffa]
MSRDSPSLAATVFTPDVMQPFVAVNNSRPNVDPPDPGRHHDPMSLGLASDMDAGVNVFTENKEVALVEGDVTHSMVDGLISIVFSKQVQALAVKNFDLTMVVKLLGRRIGYNTLHSRLLDIWKPTEAFRLMDIENDYFLVTFKSRSDYSNAISGGPWMIPVLLLQSLILILSLRMKLPKSRLLTPTLIPDDSRSGSAAPGLPLPTAVDPRGKGKRPYATSSSKSGPSPSRQNSSLCNTRFTLFPRPPTWLNKSNHSAVVVSESDDPVILTDDSIPAMSLSSSNVATCKPECSFAVGVATGS